MPRSCPKCGWSNVRHSLPDGPVDTLLGLMLLVPYRCRDCRHRFFQFRNTGSKIFAVVLGLTVLVVGFRFAGERRGWFQGVPSTLGALRPVR